MFKYLKSVIPGLLLMIFTFSSCYNSDDVGENLYTFTGKMLGQYITEDTTTTEFGKLLEKANVLGLLNSYGDYTCFVPTNEAMRAFYKSKGKTSLDDFTPDSLKLIAYDHLINGYALLSSDFVIGRQPEMSMSGRYFTINYSDDFIPYVNKTSEIIQKDIIVHNGVIDKINKVLDPVREGLADAVSKDSIFSLFYKALVQTGLVDSILKTTDETYKVTDEEEQELLAATVGGVPSDRVVPMTRKYGYTLLMESNATLAKNGITDLKSMEEYAAKVYDQVYPDDAGITDITNRKNSLNRFIAYHILNKELSKDKIIRAYDTGHMIKLPSHAYDLYEYIQTMCPNTLIEAKIDRTNNQEYLNYINETGQHVDIDPTDYDNDASNGVFHEIDNMLVFSKPFYDELSTKRLRFDIASFFPELTNNNMRGRPSDNEILYRFAIPLRYLSNLQGSDNTVIGYTTANDKLMNYEGDEFFVPTVNGNLYDFTLTTPPVPAGTYEVRFDYQANGRRGVAQFYLDGTPCGVPVNLNKTGNSPDIGYETPGSVLDDPMGYLNDKTMRNLGYMKGPNSFKSINTEWYSGQSARYNGGNLRKIMGTYTFTSMEHHKIHIVGLSGGQFQIDFVEFVPTSLLENEDID